jgi:hypothetical protein
MRVFSPLSSSIQLTTSTVPVGGATQQNSCRRRDTSVHTHRIYKNRVTVSIPWRIGGLPEAGDGETEGDMVQPVGDGGGSLNDAAGRRLIIHKELTPLGSSLQYCIICGTGDGKVECPRCEGHGWVLTRPGGAGVAGKVGQARCKLCGGHVRECMNV